MLFKTAVDINGGETFFFFFSAPLAEIQKLNYDVSEKLQYVSVKTRLCQQYIRNQTSA